MSHNVIATENLNRYHTNIILMPKYINIILYNILYYYGDTTTNLMKSLPN